MVGQLLKDRRLARGLSQTEVARRAGSSQRQVSRLENDEDGTPRRDTLERFGAVLGITLPEFYQAMGAIDLEGLEMQPAVPGLPPALAEAMRQMVLDHPELAAQFDAAKDDDDFPAQVRTLAQALGYTVKGWLADRE